MTFALLLYEKLIQNRVENKSLRPSRREVVTRAREVIFAYLFSHSAIGVIFGSKQI